MGGGLSGLAAAFLYRQRMGHNARVLVLDNHDDFGGHAKRNEFRVGGTDLIGYGGSQSIDTPQHYSAAAKKVLADIGVQTGRFYDYFDQDFFGSRNLGRGIYFGSEAYGRALVLPDVTRGRDGDGPEDVEALVGQYPLPPVPAPH
ncbi:MAG: NAD(P)-binding protein [Woeseiaceae bacterium]|nr:NAD(P)-binding protein [Woeseiaceae bacterium]